MGKSQVVTRAHTEHLSPVRQRLAVGCETDGELLLRHSCQISEIHHQIRIFFPPVKADHTKTCTFSVFRDRPLIRTRNRGLLKSIFRFGTLSRRQRDVSTSLFGSHSRHRLTVPSPLRRGTKDAGRLRLFDDWWQRVSPRTQDRITTGLQNQSRHCLHRQNPLRYSQTRGQAVGYNDTVASVSGMLCPVFAHRSTDLSPSTCGERP